MTYGTIVTTIVPYVVLYLLLPYLRNTCNLHTLTTVNSAPAALGLPHLAQPKSETLSDSPAGPTESVERSLHRLALRLARETVAARAECAVLAAEIREIETTGDTAFRLERCCARWKGWLCFICATYVHKLLKCPHARSFLAIGATIVPFVLQRLRFLFVLRAASRCSP